MLTGEKIIAQQNGDTMAEPNWRNRTLFHGDNLRFLRAMNSESVDLISDNGLDSGVREWGGYRMS